MSKEQWVGLGVGFFATLLPPVVFRMTGQSWLDGAEISINIYTQVSFGFVVFDALLAIYGVRHIVNELSSRRSRDGIKRVILMIQDFVFGISRM